MEADAVAIGEEAASAVAEIDETLRANIAAIFKAAKETAVVVSASTPTGAAAGAAAADVSAIPRASSLPELAIASEAGRDGDDEIDPSMKAALEAQVQLEIGKFRHRQAERDKYVSSDVSHKYSMYLLCCIVMDMIIREVEEQRKARMKDRLKQIKERLEAATATETAAANAKDAISGVNGRYGDK